jgi:hypothetical protein
VLGKSACLFLQSGAIVSYVNDKRNEKYDSHGLNTLVLHRTVYPEDVFDLASEVHEYYVQLYRPQNIWKGGGPQRLFFVSPCKANLKISVGEAECGQTYCDFDAIAEKECEGMTGDNYTQCEEGVKEKVCGHFPVNEKTWGLGVPGARLWLFEKETAVLTQYPIYYPGPVPMSSVESDVYEEWQRLPEHAEGIKMCQSQSIMREAWGSVKGESWVISIFTDPDVPPLIVPAINVEPMGSIEGFCFQGDDHEEFLYKSLVFAGSVVVDIGIAAISVATLGGGTVLFAFSGAYTAYLDTTVEKFRAWPCNPASTDQATKEACKMDWVPFI